MKIFTLLSSYIMTVLICFIMVPVLHHKQKERKKYCDLNGKTPSCFSRFLHEPSILLRVIILIVSFLAI